MTNTGTPKYKAPEILLGWNSDYNELIDLWSAGAVLYYIVCGGIHAFNFENVPEIEKAIEKGDFDRTIPQYQSLSSTCKDLISQLMNLDLGKRLNAT